MSYSDLDVLKLLQTREAFDKYHTFILEKAVLEETWHILEGIREYYSSHPASTEIDWVTFRTSFLVTAAAKLGPVRTAHLAAILDVIIASPSMSKDSDDLVLYFVDMYHAQRVREHVDKIIGGSHKTKLDDIEGILDQHEKDRALIKTEDLKDLLVFSDMEGVYERIYRGDGLEWRLEDLNVSIGPLRAGDMICVTACPNVGKTRFITNEITHFVTQLPPEDRRILFINNEETADAIWNAIYCSYFDKTDDDVLKNVVKFEEKWNKEVGKEAIAVYHNTTGTTREIERVIKAYKPKVVVYNQLYKIHLLGKQTGTEAEQYRLRYNFGRVMADKHRHVAIAAHQAGYLAAGEKWVTQEQLYGGKTGIPGECDVIIGIGKTYDPLDKENRFINIARNKLPSGPRTIPDLREDSHFVVKFKAGHGRYETLEYR